MNRLGINYICVSPDIDESPRGETHADELAKRLAFTKAQVIAAQNPNAIVIGSDQVAWREHVPHDFIGKPMTIENAKAQLANNSGRTVFLALPSACNGSIEILNKRWLNIIKLNFEP